MAKTTRIDWCDSTFNPWTGYTKDQVGRRTSAADWRRPLSLNQKAAAEGVRCRVFCSSSADWLDSEPPVEWLVDLLDLIRQTPHLDWLLLSKRICTWSERIHGAIEHVAGLPMEDTVTAFYAVEMLKWLRGWTNGQPPANVWVGAAVATQQEADRDTPTLLSIPARVRWLSVEPVLGPVVLQGLAADETMEDNEYREYLRIEPNKNGFAGPGNTIDWVVWDGCPPNATARYDLDALVRSLGKRSSHAIDENQGGNHRPPHSTGAKIMTNEHAATTVRPGSDQGSASVRDCLAVLTDWAVSNVGPENVNLHPELVQAMEALAGPAPAQLQLTEEEIASAYLLIARGLDDLNHYLSDNDPAKDGYSADEVQALVELQLAGPKIANIFEGASTRCDRHDEPAAPTP